MTEGVSIRDNSASQGMGTYIPQGDETFAMWVKIPTTQLNVGGIQVVTTFPYDGSCDRIIGNGGGVNMQSNVWNEVNYSDPTNLVDAQWHHIAYVIDKASGFYTYVDGVLTSSSTAAVGNCAGGHCSGFNWATTYNVGRGFNCRYGADFFKGIMDEVRIYNKPLTAQQVADLYAATKLA